VVDETRRLVGIVTARDLMRFLREKGGLASDILVGSLMAAPVVTVEASESLVAAAERMQAHCIRHLPVINPAGGLIGVVTRRDLIAAQRSSLSKLRPLDPDARVSEVYHPDVWSIAAEASVLNAATLLADHRFGCLPVVEGKSLVGIITATDLLALMQAPRVKRDGPPPVLRVRDYMSAPVVTVSPGDSLETARACCHEHGISGLAVVEKDGVLLGAVSQSDLLRATKDGRETPFLQRRVIEVMSATTYTVAPELGLAAAAKLLLDRGVHRLFVMEKERLVGVITGRDFMRAARDRRIRRPIRDLMSRVLFTIAPGEPVEVASSFLEHAGVTGLIVRKAIWPSGIFSRREAVCEVSLGGPVAKNISQQFLVICDDLPIYSAAAQALARGARWLFPVRDGEVQGVLTGTDFARAWSELMETAEPSRWPALATGTRF
jgi:CBS domain-containing membrane protein